jgi:hypothetical protein
MCVDAPVRQRVLIMKQVNHLLFRDDQYGRRGHGGLQANGVARQRPLTEKVAGPRHRHNGLFAPVRQHRELDRACLNVQDAVGRIALGK